LFLIILFLDIEPTVTKGEVTDTRAATFGDFSLDLVIFEVI